MHIPNQTYYLTTVLCPTSGSGVFAKPDTTRQHSCGRPITPGALRRTSTSIGLASEQATIRSIDYLHNRI